MSVKSVPGINVVSSAPKMPQNAPTDKVSRVVAEDKFPDDALRRPTRKIEVHHLPPIPETDETSESPPQASTSENLKPPASKPSIALKMLADLKKREAEARRNLK